MIRIKRLDIFIVRQFAMLFVGTFCISQFVLMMQFMWRYVDELIGKGLSVEVLAQFFWYMGLMLVPQALPLAILLSSLIAFGNLGESSELTSIKAAGISLLQAFRSLIVLTAFIMLGSFFFQNVVAPNANRKFMQLLAAMKQKNPELEIPEGVFYDGIPDCNLYVQKKDINTGMLYGVMIYRMTNSFEDAAIILADSGRLQTTADKKHLLLQLYKGEWFENMQTQSIVGNANVPYRRETFVTKRILLDFDADLNVDNNLFAGDARGKSLDDIRSGLKQTNLSLDSIGRGVYGDIRRMYFSRYMPQKKDTVDGKRLLAKAKAAQLDIDSIYGRLTTDEKKAVTSQALSEVRMVHDYLAFSGLTAADGNRIVREHYLEWINKYTTALLCLIFFFIGAPLGAIIRKGGLGVPVIISVIVFIIYFILDDTGFRMARLGAWPVWLAKGLAPAVLIPTAVFFTHKANKDSMVFNVDLYRNFFMRLFGLRLRRSMSLKEVVIDEPHYAADKERLQTITEDIVAYNKEHKLFLMPNVVNVFFRYVPDHEIERISEELESVIADLGNTQERDIMKLLQQYPVMSIKAHTRPFDRKWMNILAFIMLPVGTFLYLRMWRFRLRLFGDLKTIHSLNDGIIGKIDTLLYNRGQASCDAI
ncbi:MAG: LptF/LptG family permease [Prevotella sp.]